MQVREHTRCPRQCRDHDPIVLGISATFGSERLQERIHNILWILIPYLEYRQFDRAFHTDTRDLDVRRRNDGVIYVAHVFGEMRDEPGFEAGDSTIELTDSDLISKDSPNLELQIDELIRISHRAQNTMYETLPLQQQN